ncbi:biliverdin-producing heme oxygenase [Paraburkholderia sp. J94]|uniref:biliverdin-producing heme oxygenase n=1 Tax=Paraburkholderia sp. J94 TaxID=2805441 RepID=UPI002AB0A102|nr:biliverdin-producing heme oxygenase [Paraburkholderia sp. J94]
MTAIRSAAESSFVDVLGALRLATAARHEAVEGAMPLAGGAPSLAHYRLHLQVLRDWLAPLEAWLERFADGPQDAASLPQLARLPLIERDLAHPALRAHAREAAELADAFADSRSGQRAEAPAPSAALAADVAWRWGACYVIEGSQLGGAVLLRKHALAFAPHPLDYLSGDGNAPGPRWHAFIAAMRRDVHTPADVDRACAGARAAFDRLIALLPQASQTEAATAMPEARVAAA